MDTTAVSRAIAEKIDVADFYGSLAGWDGENNARCPFPERHSGGDDSTPSLKVFRDTGGCFCHGCGYKATAPMYFYADVKGLDHEKACRILYSRHVEKLVPYESWKGAHKALMANPLVLEKLLEARGLSRETARRFFLGYDGGRLTIPVMNDLGLCVNLRRYDLYKSSPVKILSYDKGMGSGRLYPLPSLAGGEVFLVEGELDALIGAQHGLPCVSSTLGAAVWREEWSALFKGKIVYVIPDNDKPGEDGALRRADSISKAGALGCAILRLPGLKKPGEDLTDWFLKHGGTAERLRGIAAGLEVRGAKKAREAAPRPEASPSPAKAQAQGREEEMVARAEAAWGELALAGRFFRDGEGGLFYVAPGCGVCPVTKEPGPFMHRLTRVNPLFNAATAVGRFVYEYIRHEASVSDELKKSAVWTATHRGALYASADGEHIIKCSEAGFESVRNAVNPDGVLLDAPLRGMGFSVPGKEGPARGLGLLKSLFLDNLALCPEDRYLLLSWIMGALFRDHVRPKPLVRLVARTAYGKSTASKLVSLLVYGQEMLQASASTTAALYEMGARYPLIILDNLEARNMTPQVEDFLLIAATGGMKSKRKLTSDSGMVQYRSDCLVLTNGIEPFSKHELIDRTVELPLDLEKYGSESFHEARTFAALREARPEIMRSLLFLAQRYVLPRLNAGDAGRVASELGSHGKERFNEFLAVMCLCLDALWGYSPLEGHQSPRTVVERWLGSQTRSLTEQSEGTDEVLYYLDTLVDRWDQLSLAGCRVRVDREKGKTVVLFGARELLSDFRVLAKSLGIRCPWATERQLGVRLVDSAGVLSRNGWKSKEYMSGGRKRHRLEREEAIKKP